jgi:hypothetical protein
MGGREKGYISPLLSNLALDYSQKAREGLVASVLFPRIQVGKPTGKYAVFDKDNVYKVPDVTFAGERSQAHEFYSSGTMKTYTTERYGLKTFIDEADLQFMEGPFKLWEKRRVEALTGALEMAQEKRVADTVASLSGRSTSLSGVGTAKTNKWSSASDTAGGDPYAAVVDAISQLFYRPNVMILPEAVYDALEYHPRLLNKLGEANLIKKVDAANLSKLFRVDKVIIAKGRADFEKKNSSKTLNLSGIWGSNVVLAYVSTVWDEPCAGKTLMVNYPQADNSGYVVRTWDVEDGGMLGGQYVQVAHDVCEMVVSPELIYTIKDVL